ncbi:MAG: DUF3305 domain-containing protein [Alphaproteobacteria bacterium]|nr:DUF3305 domain-containing protein [Alphaproteobacteria bacterium]
MGTETRPVGVVVERRKLNSAWQDHAWLPVQILPGIPQCADWTLLAREGEVDRYYAGAAEIRLFRHETETLRHNLESPSPSLFVILRHAADERGVELLGVTACPGEAQAHADTGDDIVEAVAMPAPILEWVADYVRRHHVEKPRFKRRRDRADPEALANRSALLRDDPLRRMPEDE